MFIDFKKVLERAENENAKWWVDIHTEEPLDRNDGELFALMGTEVYEIYEAQKKEEDEHLPQFLNLEVECADLLIRVADYISHRLTDLTVIEIRTGFLITRRFDAHIVSLYNSLARATEAARRGNKNSVMAALEMTIFTTCSLFKNYSGVENAGERLEEVINAKMDYNLKRSDHSLEERRKEGGKKF